MSLPFDRPDVCTYMASQTLVTSAPLWENKITKKNLITLSFLNWYGNSYAILWIRSFAGDVIDTVLANNTTQ